MTLLVKEKKRMNSPCSPGISSTPVQIVHAIAKPAAWIPPTVAPPIAALWHQANRLPASTNPNDAYQDAAVVPAAGSNASNPAAPSEGIIKTDLPAELSCTLQLLQDRHIFGPTLALLEASTYAPEPVRPTSDPEATIQAASRPGPQVARRQFP